MPELVAAIEAYLALHNQDPEPFSWTAKSSHILENVNRSQAAVHKSQPV